jgi:hypothetical protein
VVFIDDGRQAVDQRADIDVASLVMVRIILDLHDDRIGRD